MVYESGVPQRKNNAMGDGIMGSNETFGCKQMGESKGPNMGSSKSEIMKDDDRGAGKPVKHTSGKMPAQAAADHGKHKYTGMA